VELFVTKPARQPSSPTFVDRQSKDTKEPMQQGSATMSQLDFVSATAPDRPELSIVVPCYNEEEGIDELVRRCCESAEAVFGASFELILVDDGSTDGTWDRISGQLEKRSQLVAVRLSRNHGHQLALTAGLSAVRGRLVFVLDADERIHGRCRLWAANKPRG
jgi:cellulose synthase/poly-beta-1,6-N-acetylglucosamine synthase-like glycosyltransferase